MAVLHHSLLLALLSADFDTYYQLVGDNFDTYSNSSVTSLNQFDEKTYEFKADRGRGI